MGNSIATLAQKKLSHLKVQTQRSEWLPVTLNIGFAPSLSEYRIYQKDSRPGKIAAGGIWALKSGINCPAVAELLTP